MSNTDVMNPWLVALASVAALALGVVAMQTAATSVDAAASGDTSTSPRSDSLDADPTSDASNGPRFAVPVTSSQPTLGPIDALVTIVEFCDLRGAACREADVALRAVMEKHVGQVRWVHRHFFDRHDATAALVNHVARGVHYSAGKFWPLREQLLALPDTAALDMHSMQGMVEALGVAWLPIQRGLERGGYAQLIAGDHVFAERFGVTSAPGLFVNGRRLMKHESEPLQRALERLVADELANAQSLVADGTLPAELYAKLIADGLWNVDGASAANHAAGDAR